MITGSIVKNFTLSEMSNNLSKDSVKLVLNPAVIEFAQMIQELRNFYGKPMKVNSWYRTPSFNKSIKGSSNSAHLNGRAVDLAVTDYLRLSYKWKQICASHDKIGGVNMYDTFMHFTDYEDKFGYKQFVVRDYRKEKK